MALIKCSECQYTISDKAKFCVNCGATNGGILTLIREKKFGGSLVTWTVSKNGVIIGELTNGQTLEIITDENFVLEVSAVFNNIVSTGRITIKKGETRTVIAKPGMWANFKFIEK